MSQNLLPFVYTLMVDDLGVESNEAELDRIFEEKLYVNKRLPLVERNVRIAGEDKAWTLKNTSASVAGENVKMDGSSHALNTSFDVKDEHAHGSALPFLQKEDVLDLNYAKDSLKNEAGNSCNLEKPSIEAHLEDSGKKVTFVVGACPDNPCHTNLAGDRVDVDENGSKEKVRRLEIEFNRMVMAHKKTIKIRSKLYRFIYSEVSAVQDELVGRITILEKENGRLKRELDHAEKRMESYKTYAKAYHQMLVEKICIWKESLEKQVCEYLSRRAR